MLVAKAIGIYNESILQYHLQDDVKGNYPNPYAEGSIEFLFYEKNMIDTIQWHLEDIIRNPEIGPHEALAIKRSIDSYNQKRTDMVEYIDAWILNEYKNVAPVDGAACNTETPAWALDRLSILQLKIFHMAIEADRADADENHRKQCIGKLHILQTQNQDLCLSIQQLLSDIAAGQKVMKLYKQMKMYNDESLNPVLYQRK